MPAWAPNPPRLYVRPALAFHLPRFSGLQNILYLITRISVVVEHHGRDIPSGLDIII